MSDFDFKNVSDSLYSSFIARDFFAKVLPGSIVLAAIALSFLNYDTLTQKVKDLPLMFGLLLYGLAWIVGFAVQAIAETLRLSRSFPSDETEDVFRARMTEYRALEMKPSLALQRERYVVIKEATGNTGVAAILALCMLGITRVCGLGLWPYVGLAVLAAVVLLVESSKHAKRQRDWEQKAIAQQKALNAQQAKDGT